MHCLTDLTETLWMWKRGARICGRIDSKRQVVAWGVPGKGGEGQLDSSLIRGLEQSIRTDRKTK